MDVDYLILGSGLSALTFAALMAKAGMRVLVLEAHEFPGGYGHTFVEKSKKYEYRFNAQLHYVWDCGTGDPVNLVLKKLGLEDKVTFVRYGENGFDHIKIPDYSLDIPSNFDLLIQRLTDLFPKHSTAIIEFLVMSRRIARATRYLRKPPHVTYLDYARKNIKSFELLKYYNASLQQIFERFAIPKPAQALLAGQWLDFLLPPKLLSFYAWSILFDGYIRGAYYPKHHFEHVIQSLVDVITNNKGEIIYNKVITHILKDKKQITGVITRDTNPPFHLQQYSGKTIICNIDPKQAAQMIGLESFSTKLRNQLNYDYSCSSFVVYGAVEGINLRDYGFGDHNLFHSEGLNLNEIFDAMYYHMDYSRLSFGIATPSLVTNDNMGCPHGQQLFELLTVANYNLFSQLKYRDTSLYNKTKNNLFNRMLDIIEQHYIPNFREHIVFKMLGSPTTNKSYCWAPEGNSYGMNLTPRNMRLDKLGFSTSFKNFFFCNASAGSPGFAKAFNNGAMLYENLTNDTVLSFN